MSTTMDRTTASTSHKTRAPWLIMAAKELRENTKWAIAAALILTFSTVYQTFNINRDILNYWASIHTLFQLGAPVIALLLGLIQIVPEQRRDLLAFVLHRPAPRASLFWGKTAAGLLLYAVVTGIPLLGAYFWASTPGHLSGPIVPQLAQMGVYAILAGIPFYFCSMLAALRPARWYGSRILPLIAPIPLVFIGTSSWPTEFWQACILAALAIVASAAAARTAFVSLGEFRSADISSRAGRGGLGVVLYSGCAIALASLFAAGSFVSELTVGRQEHYVYRNYRVSHGGNIGAFTQRDSTLSYHIVYSATGAALGGERHDDISNTQDLDHSKDTLWLNNHVMEVVPFTNPFRYIRQTSSWYQVIGGRQLVSYSPETHLPGWVMGPNGVARYASRQSAGQFGSGFRVMGINQEPEFLVVDGQNCYAVNTATRTVQKVALPNTNQKIQMVTSVSDNANQNQNMPAYVISTYKQHYVVDGAGHILYTVKRESTSSTDIIGSPTGTLYFAYASAAGPAGLISIWSASGKHIDTVSLPQLERGMATGSEPPFELFIPTGVIAIYSGIAFALRNSSLQAQMGFNVMTALWFHAKMLQSCLAGLVCMVLAWLIARRAGFSKGQCAAWAFGGFWLGIPGVMMLLAMYAWPLLVECPNCSRKRSVDRDLCEHCGAPFPSPIRDGTEILGDGDVLRAGTNFGIAARATASEEMPR